MTEAEFFAWLARQERRHELVDGRPRAMVGATLRHNRIIGNLSAALRSRPRGGACQPYTMDVAVRIPNRNIRYPDAVVDCGPYADNARAAAEPMLVAEVLSPSTMDFDQTEKLEEYRSVPGLRHILMIDTDQPRLRLHSRGEDGHWASEPFAGLAALVAIPALGIELPLVELYEGLTFQPLPRLVTPGAPE